jgi:hypothetical protein
LPYLKNVSSFKKEKRVLVVGERLLDSTRFLFLKLNMQQQPSLTEADDSSSSSSNSDDNNTTNDNDVVAKQTLLRKEILKVQTDKSLTAAEKSKRIQVIHCVVDVSSLKMYVGLTLLLFIICFLFVDFDESKFSIEIFNASETSNHQIFYIFQNYLRVIHFEQTNS